MRLLVLAISTAAFFCAEARAGHLDTDTDQRDTYALDELSREIPPRGPMQCPEIDMIQYRGDVIRYHTPVRIYVGFRERLQAFERIVQEVAIEIYGRAPRRIQHKGTYNCRRVRTIPTLLSEHALGNGIDVAVFEFGPAASGTGRNLPASLRRGFSVSIARHWGKSSGTSAMHGRFLARLTERLIEEDVFRVLLGPSYPGHKDHFHFDCAPYRLIDL